MNKKHGFTLIELLAVIVIIGILSGISIISLNKIFEKNRKNYYVSQEKMLLLAGKNYAQDYKNELPKEIGQMRKITLESLENKNYIEQVIDYKKNTCDKNNSYVLIRKISATKYEYHVNLECPDYKTDVTYNTGSLDINFELKGDIYHQNVDVNITSKQVGVKVGSYNYVIYKNNKEIKNSGNIANKNEDNPVTFTVDLDKLGTGKYTIKVIAYDNYKTISSNKSEEITIDKTGPSCGSITGESTTWTNQDRTISVKCDDNGGSGCKKEKYSKTFTDTIKISYISIYDKAGNKTNCKVNVYIDKIPPEIPTINAYKWTNNDTAPTSIKNLAKYNSGWVNKNIYTKAWTTDNFTATEDIKYEYSITGAAPNKTNVAGQTKNITTEGTSYISYRAYDQAGNYSDYSEPQEVQIDKTPPQCSAYQKTYQDQGGYWAYDEEWIKNQSTTEWTKYNRKIKVDCNDTLSGCKSDTIEKEYILDKGQIISAESFTLNDKAGNTTSCNVPIRIDKKPPTVPTMQLYTDENVDGGTTITTIAGLKKYKYNNNWVNVDVYSEASGSIGDEERTETITYKSSGKNITQVTAQKRVITNTGEYTIKYTACDDLNNCSEFTEEETIKIDKISPQCGSAYQQTLQEGQNGNWYYNGNWIEIQNNTEWTKHKRKVKVECNDTLSGCKSDTIQKEYILATNSVKSTDSFTIKDKAGNTNTCTIFVGVDKKPPTCDSITGQSTTWTNKDRAISVICDDDGSGCQKTSYSKTFKASTPIEQGEIIITDKAENSTTCSVNAYVDSISPATSYVYKSGTGCINDICKNVDIACNPNEDGTNTCTITTICDKNQISQGPTQCISGFGLKRYDLNNEGNETQISGIPTPIPDKSDEYKWEGQDSWTAKLPPETTNFSMRYKDKAGNYSKELIVNFIYKWE